jgi:hypothetical protein
MDAREGSVRQGSGDDAIITRLGLRRCPQESWSSWSRKSCTHLGKTPWTTLRFSATLGEEPEVKVTVV